MGLYFYFCAVPPQLTVGVEFHCNDASDPALFNITFMVGEIANTTGGDCHESSVCSSCISTVSMNLGIGKIVPFSYNRDLTSFFRVKTRRKEWCILEMWR